MSVKGIAVFTIVDLRDIYTNSIAPENPALDMLWLDTSVVPNALKRWNGSSWVKTGASSLDELDPEASETIIMHTSQITNTATALGFNLETLTLVNSGVNKRLTDTESYIQMYDNKIKTSVSQADITTSINGLVIGAENLLQNSGKFTSLANWHCDNSIDANVSIETQFIKITRVAGSSELAIYNDSLNKVLFDISKKYIATFKIKCTGTVVVKYAIQSKDGTQVVVPKTTVDNLNNEEKTVSLDFTPSVTAWTDMNLFIYLSSININTSFCIETIKIEKGTKATDWSPSGLELKTSTENNIDTMYSINNRLKVAEQVITPDSIISTVMDSSNFTDYKNDVQNDFTVLDQIVSSHTSSITQLNNSITSKVSQTEVTNTVNQGQLYVKGTGKDRDAHALGVISGTTFADKSTIGLHLYTINRSTLAATFVDTYDVFNDWGQHDAMATVLNGLNSSVIVVVISYDAIRIEDGVLIDALNRCGYSGKKFGSNRIPFAFIGIPGIGQGAGLEYISTTGATAPYAELSTKIINGVPQGINSTLAPALSRISSAESSITQLSDSITSKVSQSDIDASINNISVGVKNLVGKFNAKTTISTIATGISGFGYTLDVNENITKEFGALILKKNTTYIVSFIAWCAAGIQPLIMDINPDDIMTDYSVTLGTTANTYIYKFTTSNTDSVSNCNMRFWNYTQTRTSKVYITDIVLTEGTKAPTNYLVPPEDITNRISSAESSITQLSTSITSKVDVAGVKSTITQSASEVQTAFNGATGLFTIKNGNLEVRKNDTDKVFWVDVNTGSVRMQNGMFGLVKIRTINDQTVNDVVFSFVEDGYQNTGIEMGSTNVVNTPYIDFHTTGKVRDHDARIIAGAGDTSSTAGNNTAELILNAKNVLFWQDSSSIIAKLKIECATGNVYTAGSYGYTDGTVDIAPRGRYGVYEVSGEFVKATPQQYIQFGVNTSDEQGHLVSGVYGVNCWNSDISYKKDISLSKINALSFINKIKHEEFTWKESGVFQELGLISQELYEVNKNWVTKVLQPDGTELMQPYEPTIIPYITKAIQELDLKIENVIKLLKSINIG